MAFGERTLLILFLSGALAGGSADAEEMKPSATLTIAQTQVERILRGDIGRGTLKLDGISYGFLTGGLTADGIGTHRPQVVGDVYHLIDVADAEGVYFEAEAGVALVEGEGGGMWIQNTKGVTLHLRDSADGELALSVSIEGFRLHDLEAQYIQGSAP